MYLQRDLQTRIDDAAPSQISMKHTVRVQTALAVRVLCLIPRAIRQRGRPYCCFELLQPPKQAVSAFLVTFS